MPLQLVKQERFDIDFPGLDHGKAYLAARLASNIAVFRFVPVMKRFALCAALFLAIAFLICACASRDETTAEQSRSHSTAAVPGETVPGEGSFAPGPPGSSGSVRW